MEITRSRRGWASTTPCPKSLLPGVLGGRKTQIRGGLGLFQGTNPAVWVANSYQTAGVLNTVTYGSSYLELDRLPRSPS